MERTPTYSLRPTTRDRRARNVWLSFTVLSLMVGLVDCQVIAPPHLVDVTEHDEYWEGFEKNGIYEIQRDVFLKRDPERPKQKHALAVSRRDRIFGKEHAAPNSVEDFLKNRGDWSHVVGVVAAGTRIQVQRLYAIDALFIPRQPVYPCGTILDGEFALIETAIGDLCDIIDEDDQPMLPRPDDRLLRLVE